MEKKNGKEDKQTDEELKELKDDTEVEVKDGKKKRAGVSVRELFKFADGVDGLLMLFGSLCGVAFGMVRPVSFIIFGSVIGKFIKYGSQMNLVGNPNTTTIMNTTHAPTVIPIDISGAVQELAIYYVVLGVCIIVFGFIQVHFWSLTAVRQTYRIRKKFFESILRQDIGWFDVNDVGGLSSRLAEDLVKLNNGMGEKVGQLVQSFFTIFGGIGVGFYYSWEISLVLLAAAPVLAVLMAFLGRLIGSLATMEQEGYADAGFVANEVISSIRTVVAFGGEEEEIARYDKQLINSQKAGVKKSWAMGLSIASFYVVMYATYALGFWYGSTLVAKGKINGGDVLTVIFSITTGGMEIGQLAPNFETLLNACGAATFVYDLIAKIPFIDCMSTEGKAIKEVKGDLTFKDVHFSYPSRKDNKILDGFNLDVKSGTTIALVGESGCGKSTVVKLVERFYDVDQGVVSLDGVDVKDLNLKWLRTNFGVVSQEPVLFDMTIAENIKLGESSDVTHDDIIAAAKAANAHDFIMKLPKKYETNVGEGGTQLSGGQKQRIAIARALVRNPKIILFDEATSALDTESEGLVQAALEKASEGRTTIVIAHRLSTVRNADVIVVIKDGKVVESGTHSELLQKKGAYNDLVVMQTIAGLEIDEEELVNSGDEEEKVVMEKIIRAVSISLGTAETMDMADHVRDYIRRNSAVSISSIKDKKKKKKKIKKNKDTNLEEEDIEPADYTRILKMNISEWPYLLVGCIFSASTGLQPVVFSIIMSGILTVFTSPATIEKESVTWALLFLLLGFVNSINIFTTSLTFGISSEILTRRIRRTTFAALMKQDMAYYDEEQNNTGHLTGRLCHDAAKIQGSTGRRFNMVINMSVLMVAGLVFGMYHSWKMTLSILAFLPFIFLSTFVQMKFYKDFATKQSKVLIDANAVANEAIVNVRTVACLGREDFFVSKYNRMIDNSIRQAIKNSLITGLSFGSTSGIVQFAIAAIFVLGGKFVSEGDLEVRNFFRVIFASLISGLVAGRITSLAPDFIEAKVSAARIFKILDRVPTIDSTSGGDRLKSVDGNIDFEGISFNYPSRPDITVLSDFSLDIKAGQKVALVGQSGCGKTTTIGLLEQFYNPRNGSILLDGRNTNELDIKWLRSQLGLVSQEPVIFSRSIKDNIKYGLLKDVTDEDIENAAKKANIHSFISTLPKGYDTVVGEKGVLISGGQKQRVAIARALIRDPKIMLLDEATSALDSESEKAVQEALDAAMEGRTSIIIAHRLSTVQNADVIVVLKDGQVVEKGTHKELLALKGAYYTLNVNQI